MRSELYNLWLFALAIAKTSLLCGFAPGLALAFFGPRVAKFHAPFTLGKLYLVGGYHTGDFIGEVLRADRDFAWVRVTDPKRPFPHVPNRCSFPQCIREDFHAGEHEVIRVREGAVIEVNWHAATWLPVLQNKFGVGALRPEQSEPGQVLGSNPRFVSDSFSANSKSSGDGQLAGITRIESRPLDPWATSPSRKVRHA